MRRPLDGDLVSRLGHDACRRLRRIRIQCVVCDVDDLPLGLPRRRDPLVSTRQMSARSPVVSILLCTYNRRHLIERAIRSVLAQTWPHWELVIVDDGSTDDTAAAVLPLANRDARMVYVWHPNQGLPLARNLGLRVATGQYIAILDSDDEYAPQHLERRVKYLAANPEVEVLFGGRKLLGPQSRQFVPDAVRAGKKVHLSKCHTAGTLFVKRSVLRAVKGYRNIPFSEDRDLQLRLKAKYEWRNVSFPTYLYHLDADNRLCDLYGDGGIDRVLASRGQAGLNGAS